MRVVARSRFATIAIRAWALLSDTTTIKDEDGTPRRHRVSRAEGRAYQVAGLRVIFHRTYAIVVATDGQIAAVADRLLD